MTVHAETRPLETPLAGGGPGLTATVEPMVTGTLGAPAIIGSSPIGRVGTLRLLREANQEQPRLPVPAFLIRHPKAGPILVDTGLHPSIASDPTENLGRMGSWFLKPALEPGEDVPAQLRAKGVDPAAIRLVILTHLHVDHASAIADFPNSTLLVTADEWRTATSGLFPLFKGYRRQQFDYTFDFRTVEFEGEQVHSYASFGRTIDLFGDGSIRLASTPGHTPGHQSVIVRLKDRDMVICGDAVYRSEQLEEGSDLPGLMADPHNFRRSLQEIRLFHRQYPEAVMTPGHDPGFYESIPDRYS
ncbi:MAG: N-acyl homoserine lactonase family protein [Solirubrobacterales bacterium]|nr:N-acyl homoserine lactonase family protein [Solirubrobacterales bacterium]